ncbi:MAG: ATP-binding protein [Anaerolineales bacterium]|jgi:signal transduction histidine kinase
MDPAVTPLTTIRCPQCGAPIPPNERNCPECGLDLLLAAELLLRSRLSETLAPAPLEPSSLEELVPRLGDALLRERLITELQLEQALQAQSASQSRGVARRLGEMLVEQGVLNPKDLDRVVAQQISRLQHALQAANRNLEQRVMERTAELAQALERLSELDRLKANFVGNISHELRTPMTQVVGYVELLSEGALGSLSPEQQGPLQSLRRATARLESLIEDLIQFAATTRGEVQLALSQCDIISVAQEAMSHAKLRAGRGKVVMRLEAEPGLPPVQADRQRIGWVIAQLLDNSLKFTPPGGQVTLGIRRSPKGVRLSVEDTGIGIPQSRIAELFTPFHQLDGSTTRRYSGTGLGLALAQQIVEAHGSQIRVESAEAKGSSFSFELDLAQG